MSVMTNGLRIATNAWMPSATHLTACGPQHNIIFLRINRYSSFFMKAPRHVGQSRTECESFG